MSQPSPQSRLPARTAVWTILAVSFLLRAVLARRGGQLFWPDEDRFEQSRKIAALLFDGRFHDALGRLLGQPDHLLFKAAGLVPASVELALGTPTWVSALFFAAASTWVLWLIHRVARAAGGSDTEALIALALAACTTSLFYYSRHFFPYDLALGFFLCALLAGLHEPTSPRRSFVAGLCAALGYLSYNGYWTLGAVLLGAHVLLALPNPRAAATRLAYALLGLTLPLFLLVALCRVFGHDFFALTLSFAGTADQGELDAAWEFAALCFWETEHTLALLWGLLLLMSLDRGERPASLRTFLWPAVVMVLGALLLVPPGLFHHFAVTARHLRVLAPFLCLAAAGVLYHHPAFRAKPRLVATVLGFVALQAAFNFAPALAQVFPREFQAMGASLLDEARQSDLGPYKIVNASFLHNAKWAPVAAPAGVVLLQRDHPFQYGPYLLEGYSLALRSTFLERDLAMRVIRLDAGGAPVRGYPAGWLELTLRFPSEPQSLLPEPLLSTGVPGRGDTIFINYLGRDRFVIGHDHIGGGANLAPERPLDRQQTHRILIGLDTFFPPGALAREPRRFVVWNDDVLLHSRAELHPTTAAQIALGHNFIGTSTAIAQLSAEIVSFRRIGYPALAPAFAQPPGALRLTLLLSPSPEAIYSEPLLSAGAPGHGDLLFLRSEGGGRFRLGHDHWGSGAVLSEPFTLDLSRLQELVVSFGPFLPPDAGATSRRRLFGSFNGQVVFNRVVDFHESTLADLRLGDNRAGSTAAGPRVVTELLTSDPAAPASLPLSLPDRPGVVRLKLRFFGPLSAGRTDPLLSTGESGRGDLIFIRFDGQGHFQIGHDHWGYGTVFSEPQPLDETRPLDLTVAADPLLDPSAAETARFHGRLYVAANGKVVLDRAAIFHPALPDSHAFGLNRIGASTAAELLGADLLDIEPLSAETIRALP